VGFKNLAIAVLPLHDDGTVTLVGQNRFPSRQLQLGDSRGRRAAGRGSAGRRQARTARGDRADQAADWREILRMQLSNSVTDEICHGFLAMA
jgi:hypothetical protein